MTTAPKPGPGRDGNRTPEWDREKEADDLLAEVDDSALEDGQDEGDDEGGLRDRLLRRRHRPPRKRLSELLTEIGADSTRARISIGDLLKAMHGRAIGALLLLFAAPNVLPTPPGTSSILGLPLVYLAAQMMLGRVPWLPRFISERSIYRSDFIAMIDRASPILTRAERLLKPRLGWLVTAPMERIIGGTCFLLAVILLLPIPLGNMLPALAICLFAFGVLERDGLWIIAGTLVSAVALVIVSGVIWAGVKMVIFLVMNAF